MKYRAISITIVIIWIICAAIIIAREDVSALTILIYALINTVFLALFGFRSPAHPDNGVENKE